MIIRLQDLDEFYRKFLGARITLEQVDEVFKTWLTCRKNDPNCPSLRFTTPDDWETPFWPKRIVDIVSVTNRDETLMVRVQILNNISDPWTHTIPSNHLSDFLKDFFWIKDPEESFWVTVGPYKPKLD